MSNVVILEGPTIQAMLRNGQIIEEFPIMRSLAERVSPKQKRGCGSCAAKNRTNITDFNNVKVAIANMPLQQKARLKALLNATEIKFYYVNANRQKVKITF